MIIDLRPAFRALPSFCRNFMPYSWYAEEWWNLNSELARWIVPQLVALRDKGNGCPGSIYMESGEDDEVAFEKWRGILTEMIEGFEVHIEDCPVNPRECEKIRRAYDLLSRHWSGLWD